MFRKANQLMIAAYLSVTGYMENLKEELKSDERGLSGVVVAVMLILVAILAVAVLWKNLETWLNTFWSQITGEADKLNSGNS